MTERSLEHIERGGDADVRPPHYHWNFAALVTDFASFGLGFTFVHPNSVLPAFVRQLTDSAPLIGLASTVFSAGWMLPQLVTGQLIKDKPRKKPYMLLGMTGRVALWVTAASVWAGLTRYPTAMLTLFFLCQALFATADGVASVAWLDIMARAVPLRERGRLLGMSQFLSGLAAAGMGAVVGLILERYSFPNNYALLFTLGAAGLIPSTIAIFLLREPQTERRGLDIEHPGGGGWLHPLATDRAFRRLIVCRVLFGMLGLATPFYVVHAADVLHLPESIVGSFVMTQAASGVISSAALGFVSQRWGPRYVIRVGTAASITAPLYALAAHLVGDGLLVQGYPFVFVGLGIMNSAFLLGFLNYLVEAAPEEMRPAYIGLGNTIVSVMALAPVAGGWLLRATSYTTLFGLTALLVALSFLLSLALPRCSAPTSTLEST
jgi:MFS family permease